MSNDGVIQPFICGNDIPETARCSSDITTSDLLSSTTSSSSTTSTSVPSESFDDTREPEMPSFLGLEKSSKFNLSISENEIVVIKSSQRIVGGTINKTNKFPWVVEIIFTDENMESYVCGAAIYSSTVLLTGKSYTRSLVNIWY